MSNTNQTLLEKAKLALAALFSTEDKEKIKQLQAELADVVAAPTDTVVKTKDGMEVVVSGELKVGSAVSIVDAEGNKTAVPDGEIVLETGEAVTVVGGLITEVKPKEAEKKEETPAPAPAPADAEMAAKMAEHKKEFETKLSDTVKSFEAKLAESNKAIEVLKKQNSFLLSKFEEIANTPVITEQVTEAKKWEDMTALERRRYEKSLNK